MAGVTVTCAQLIKSTPAELYQSFVEPSHLTRFWLEHAGAPLAVGTPVEWRFMVPGAAGAHDRHRPRSWQTDRIRLVKRDARRDRDRRVRGW